jgi:hypothetical protein
MQPKNGGRDLRSFSELCQSIPHALVIPRVSSRWGLVAGEVDCGCGVGSLSGQQWTVGSGNLGGGWREKM